jgi:hypothetical protein
MSVLERFSDQMRVREKQLAAPLPLDGQVVRHGLRFRRHRTIRLVLHLLQASS